MPNAWDTPFRSYWQAWSELSIAATTKRIGPSDLVEPGVEHFLGEQLKGRCDRNRH
jgi:hypothetical protein